MNEVHDMDTNSVYRGEGSIVTWSGCLAYLKQKHEEQWALFGEQCKGQPLRDENGHLSKRFLRWLRVNYLNLIDGSVINWNDVIRDKDNLTSSLAERAEKEGLHIQPQYYCLSDLDLSGVWLKGFNSIKYASLNRVNLAGAHLSQCELWRVSLREADLRYADFSRVYLGESSLVEAQMQNARFERCHLGQSNLGMTDLEKTFFRETSLIDADLTGARIKRTDFKRSTLFGANFSGCDLRSARNIESLRGIIMDGDTKVPDSLMRLVELPFYQGEINMDPKVFARLVEPYSRGLNAFQGVPPLPVEGSTSTFTRSLEAENFRYAKLPARPVKMGR